MKKLYGSFAAKLVAVILLCLLVLAVFASAVGAVVVYEWGGYTEGYDGFLGGLIGERAGSYMGQIGWSILYGGDPETLAGNTGLQIRVLDGEGKELYSNYEGEDTLWEESRVFSPDYSITLRSDQTEFYPEVEERAVVPAATPRPYEGQRDSSEEADEVWVVSIYSTGETREFASSQEANDWARQNQIIVKGYVPRSMASQSVFRQQFQLASFLYTWRYAFLWIAGLSFLLGVLDFIFLLCAAGHRKGTEKIVPSFVEKIPFDVFTILIIGGIGICLSPLSLGISWPEGLLLMIPMTLGLGLLFLLWCMSFAVRVKLGSLLENCLLWRAFRWLWHGAGAVIRNLPLLGKWVLGIGALALVDLLFRRSAVFSYSRTTSWWFILWLLLGGVTLYAVLAFRRLRKGAKEIANGNMNYAVDEKNLFLDFKDHAHDLNHIRDGLNAAVEERIKSERFRTELITNVSHDIKTPLTSIVNYVDLLSKEQPESETQREYIEVLSRQSGKLKKLIEDLIEASKASTGSLSVELSPCDLGILLDQTAGEYGEKLSAAGLELVLQKPEQPVRVLADGRHLWRIFDNLMNNVVKYALPGTRVYLNLRLEMGKATVTFRNISREPLSVSAEELTERFVRGDASRNTEGSGLGLSIAMSLARLQKADMDIAVDGDLFKVTLSFDTVS